MKCGNTIDECLNCPHAECVLEHCDIRELYRKKEKHNAARREYYHSHRGQELATQKAYRARLAKKEARKRYWKEYYEKHREQKLAYGAAYRARQKELSTKGACIVEESGA